MNKFKKALLSTLIVAPVLMAQSFADEGETPVAQPKTSGYIDVNLTIVDGCQIGGGAGVEGETNQSWGTIDLGEHSMFSTASLSGSQNTSPKFGLSVQCGPETNDTVTMKLVSSNTVKTGSAFVLVSNKDANEKIDYNLTTDAGGSQIVAIGDNILDGVVANAQGKYNIDLYANNIELNGAQKVGVYSDRLNFEVTF